jgi:hypothetical protein
MPTKDNRRRDRRGRPLIVSASDNPFIDALVRRVQEQQLVGGSKQLRMARTPEAPHVFAPIAAAPQNESIAPTFMASRLGTKEVFGFPATWDGVVERLRRYSMAQVLHVASWVSATLPRGSAADLQTQTEIALAFFGADTPRIMGVVAEHLRLARREGEVRPLVVLFDELQVINLVKAALLVLPAKGGAGSDDSFVALGHALLMVGELIETGPDSVGELYLRGDDGVERARYALFVNTLFHGGQNDFHALARAYDLFLSDKSHLRSSSVYVDLPQLVRKRTGLMPEQLWAVLFALFGHTFAHAAQPGPPIKIDSYFRQHFKFTRSESSRFFRLVARSARAVKHQVRAHYSAEKLRPYHMLPLAEAPLITLAGGGYIPSRSLLFSALTTGLYHRILNALESRAGRSRFQAYVGRVFEDYVDRLLERACAAATGGLSIRYIDGETIRSLLRGTKRKKPKACDGLVVSGETVIVFESKAKLFSLAVRSGGGFSEFRAKHKEIFLGAAQQLDDTIQGIEQGDLSPAGIDARAIGRYFPLIVSLENLPMTPPVFDEAVRLIAQAGLLGARSSRTALIQLMDVGELEQLGVGIREGRNVVRLMERKVALAPAYSFTNFWHVEREVDLLSARDPYLADVYRSVSDRALAFFRSRALREHMRSDAASGGGKSEPVNG